MWKRGRQRVKSDPPCDRIKPIAITQKVSGELKQDCLKVGDVSLWRCVGSNVQKCARRRAAAGAPCSGVEAREAQALFTS